VSAIRRNLLSVFLYRRNLSRAKSGFVTKSVPLGELNEAERAKPPLGLPPNAERDTSRRLPFPALLAGFWPTPPISPQRQTAPEVGPRLRPNCGPHPHLLVVSSGRVHEGYHPDAGPASAASSPRERGNAPACVTISVLSLRRRGHDAARMAGNGSICQVLREPLAPILPRSWPSPRRNMNYFKWLRRSAGRECRRLLPPALSSRPGTWKARCRHKW
jgi:hypothetical protein